MSIAAYNRGSRALSHDADEREREAERRRRETFHLVLSIVNGGGIAHLKRGVTVGPYLDAVGNKSFAAFGPKGKDFIGGKMSAIHSAFRFEKER